MAKLRALLSREGADIVCEHQIDPTSENSLGTSVEERIGRNSEQAIYSLRAILEQRRYNQIALEEKHDDPSSKNSLFPGELAHINAHLHPETIHIAPLTLEAYVPELAPYVLKAADVPIEERGTETERLKTVGYLRPCEEVIPLLDLLGEAMERDGFKMHRQLKTNVWTIATIVENPKESSDE